MQDMDITIQRLRSKLYNKKKYKRMEAVQALGQIGDEQAIELLKQALCDASKTGRDGTVRVCDLAAEALEQIGTPEALRIAEEWRNDPYPYFRKALDMFDDSLELPAIRAIAQLDDKRVVDGLMYAMGGYSHAAFHTALDELTRLGQSAIPGLLKYLHNANNKYRQANAAIALGLIGDPETVPELLHERFSGSSVRRCIVTALENIGGPEAVDGLVRIHTYHSDVRSETENALQEIGSPQALTALEKLKEKQSE